MHVDFCIAPPRLFVHVFVAKANAAGVFFDATRGGESDLADTEGVCSAHTRAGSRSSSLQLRRDLLSRALIAVASPAARAWLVEARRRLAEITQPPAELQRLSAAAGRALGHEPLTDALVIPTAAGGIAVNQFTLAAAGRLALAIETLERTPRGATTWLHDYFRAGDETEQTALVRGLALLRDDAGLKPIAAEAGRSNSVALFRALALDNPYPAAYYGVREFNQLVLKALFLEQPLARVVGLAERANRELSRMCEDYVDERAAAGRNVPDDIWLALSPHASARGREMAQRHAASNRSPLP